MKNHEEIESVKRQWYPNHRKNHVARVPDLIINFDTHGPVLRQGKIYSVTPSLDTEAIALRGSGYIERLF